MRRPSEPVCHPYGADRPRALVTAPTVTFFDVTLALACFFGAGAVLERFPAPRQAVLLVGGLIVLRIGLGLLRTKAARPEGAPQAETFWKTVTRACVVAWLNPQAIIDGTMMLGAFRATLPQGQSTPFILGAAARPSPSSPQKREKFLFSTQRPPGALLPLR